MGSGGPLKLKLLVILSTHECNTVFLHMPFSSVSVLHCTCICQTEHTGNMVLVKVEDSKII